MLRRGQPEVILGSIGYWAFDNAVLWACFHAVGAAPPVAGAPALEVAGVWFAHPGRRWTLRGIDLAELKVLFAPDEEDDPDMYLVYEVEPPEVPRLQQAVAHSIDLDAYDYFVAAYRKEA